MASSLAHYCFSGTIFDPFFVLLFFFFFLSVGLCFFFCFFLFFCSACFFCVLFFYWVFMCFCVSFFCFFVFFLMLSFFFFFFKLKISCWSVLVFATFFHSSFFSVLCSIFFHKLQLEGFCNYMVFLIFFYVLFNVKSFGALNLCYFVWINFQMTSYWFCLFPSSSIIHFSIL